VKLMAQFVRIDPRTATDALFEVLRRSMDEIRWMKCRECSCGWSGDTAFCLKDNHVMCPRGHLNITRVASYDQKWALCHDIGCIYGRLPFVCNKYDMTCPRNCHGRVVMVQNSPFYKQPETRSTTVSRRLNRE